MSATYSPEKTFWNQFKEVLDRLTQERLVQEEDPTLEQYLAKQSKDIDINGKLEIQAVELSLEIEKVVNQWIVHVQQTVLSQSAGSETCLIETDAGQSGNAESIGLSKKLGCQILHAVLSSSESKESNTNFIRFLHWGFMRILNKVNLPDTDLNVGMRARGWRGPRLIQFGLSAAQVDHSLHPERILTELRQSGFLSFIKSELTNSMLLPFVENFLRSSMEKSGIVNSFSLADSFNEKIEEQWQQFQQLGLVNEETGSSLKIKLVTMAFNRWERETLIRYTQSELRPNATS